jgi:hypothetical protein
VRVTPLVSVCVPTHDRAPLLAEALRSTLAQEGVALEVVVGDDASSDASRAVVEALGDPRIRFSHSPVRLGVARTRDRCLALARGTYVAWLDSDDSYEPGALARQVAVLEAHPRVSLVHGAVHVVDAAGGRLADRGEPFATDAIEPGAVAFGHLLAANEVATSSVVARRSALQAAGPSAALASSSDWAMWLRLALRGDVAYAATPVARYRQHTATITHATSAGGERLRCDLAVVRELLRTERALVARASAAAGSSSDPRAIHTLAHAALAAKALLYAGDLRTRGRWAAALRAAGLAVRLAPRALAPLAPPLALGTARREAGACHDASRVMLQRLATDLEGTRFGARVTAAAARDADWEGTLLRAGGVVRRLVPADACVGAVAKWDPALLAASHRRGRNFPDRGTLPEGYPADSTAAVAHLEAERRRGLSHLVVPSPSFWWLEHYEGLAAHLEAHHRRLWSDADCVVFDLRGTAAA